MKYGRGLFHGVCEIQRSLVKSMTLPYFINKNCGCCSVEQCLRHFDTRQQPKFLHLKKHNVYMVGLFEGNPFKIPNKQGQEGVIRGKDDITSSMAFPMNSLGPC